MKKLEERKCCIFSIKETLKKETLKKESEKKDQTKF